METTALNKAQNPAHQIRLAVYHHDDGFQHRPPAEHPESTQRWQAVEAAIHQLKSGFERNQDTASLAIIEAPLATDEIIHLLHPAAYWQALQAREPESGAAPHALDADTWLSHGSIAAAARGAGAVCDAVEKVFQGQYQRAFCALRPPGHHAGAASPMGFCLLNPIALGAIFARRHCGAKRVAIVDFDVHHGNGTQDIFSAEPNVLYASTHQIPLYPGTGHREETGVGNLINRPLPAYAGSAEFRHTWREDILPLIAGFQPDIILMSAGFDGHQDDPLAQLNLQSEDFAWIATQLRHAADRLCGGRLVGMLEGGYNLEALTASSHAFMHALAQKDRANSIGT